MTAPASKQGNRRTMSIIITPSVENRTTLTLNIYEEILKRGGNNSAVIYFYEDTGVINDSNVYTEVLEELKKHISPDN